MKINSLSLLLNQKFALDKKFYFISGNENTLMEKIKSIIIDVFQKKQNLQILIQLVILLMKPDFLEIKIYM